MAELAEILNLSETTLAMIVKLLAVLIGLFIIKYFGKTVINQIVRRAITSDKYATARAEKMREDTLISILNAILKVTLWIFGTMLILAQLGVNIGPLIAGASIAGIAIGFGAQTIVQDFVSGLFIILENQYRVGDVVKLNDITGTVEAITVRQTIVRDSDGNKHYISNGQIQVATNLTMDFANLILNVDVAYEADIEKVKKIINQAGLELSRQAQFKQQIIKAPQFVRINDFGAHAVIIRIMGKVKPGSQWQLAGEMRLKLKAAFEKHDISMPYQQLVVHKAKE